MNNKPVSLGVFDIECNEYMKYQYLPIAMPMQPTRIEERLGPFLSLIEAAMYDYADLNNRDFMASYIYLTVKSEYQRGGCGFNRPGWHIDSYLTDNIDYIYSNIQPTIFNSGKFNLTKDHEISLQEMKEQAKEENNYTFPSCSLIRVGRAVHKVADFVEGHRIFVKITFSKEKFNLLGNSHNYLIDYNWDMKERKNSRNHPSVI